MYDERIAYYRKLSEGCIWRAKLEGGHTEEWARLAGHWELLARILVSGCRLSLIATISNGTRSQMPEGPKANSARRCEGSRRHDCEDRPGSRTVTALCGSESPPRHFACRQPPFRCRPEWHSPFDPLRAHARRSRHVSWSRKRPRRRRGAPGHQRRKPAFPTSGALTPPPPAFAFGGSARRRSEQFFNLLGRKRSAEEVTLHLIAVDVAQKRRLGIGFDAFRDDPQIELLTQGNHRAGDSLVVLVGEKTVDERLVDLQSGDGKRSSAR